MFKNINNLFERRKSYLRKTQEKNTALKQILSDFLKNEFGDVFSDTIKIDYNPREKTLIIVTQSKVLANELTIRLVSLHEFLKERGAIFGKILIK